MKNHKHHPLAYLIVIAERKKKDALLRSLLESGIRMAFTTFGKGTAKASYLKDVFGLVTEENKAVITCVLPRDKSQDIMKMLVEKFHFDKPNTGIACTIPLDKLSF